MVFAQGAKRFQRSFLDRHGRGRHLAAADRSAVLSKSCGTRRPVARSASAEPRQTASCDLFHFISLFLSSRFIGRSFRVIQVGLLGSLTSGSRGTERSTPPTYKEGPGFGCAQAMATGTQVIPPAERQEEAALSQPTNGCNSGSGDRAKLWNRPGRSATRDSVGEFKEFSRLVRVISSILILYCIAPTRPGSGASRHSCRERRLSPSKLAPPSFRYAEAPGCQPREKDRRIKPCLSPEPARSNGTSELLEERGGNFPEIADLFGRDLLDLHTTKRLSNYDVAWSVK